MTLTEKARKIKLLICDVDGVLTDGKIYIGNEGELFKAFDVKDGLGIKMLLANGVDVGDDLPDYAVIQKVGLAACPSNAVEEIVQLADFKSQYSGGAGAVRELAEFILKTQGKWESTLEKMFLHPDPNAKHRY